MVTRWKKISYSDNVKLYTITILDDQKETIMDQIFRCAGFNGHTWSPNGEFIVFYSACGESEPDNGLHIVNVETGKVYELYVKNVPMIDPQWIP